MSINRVTISGNLTRDPELRATAGGTQILNLGVAVNDRRRNPQSGEWEDYANFIDCVLFGARAESLSRMLTKGTKVCIDGRLHYSTWETKEGQRRNKIEVIVDNLDFMQRRGDSASAPSYNQGGYNSAPQAPAQNTSMDMFDQDIPF